jgi:2-oxoglutarate ferredoxin oxidoreductase subunit alpha
LLSDGYIANGSEPWLIPSVDSLPKINPNFTTVPNSENGEFLPYLRDPETLARAFALPGTKGLEHRIGGVEKADKTGVISYDPANHDFMVRTRAAKVAGVKVPDLVIDDPSDSAEVLILGWGSTYGPIWAAIQVLRETGHNVAQAHLRYINPFPKNLGDVLRSYKKVLVPEMNLGQLARMLRGEYLVDVVGFDQVRGMPFTTEQVVNATLEVFNV